MGTYLKPSISRRGKVKKVYILGIAIVLVISLLTLGLGPVMAQDNAAPSNIQMEVTINGLEKGDEAALYLSFETATAAEGVLLEQNIESSGKSITLDLRTSLKDGYYQLLLEAPPKYFRDPKGYFFQVSQSEIVNPSSRPIVFDLMSPSALNMLEAIISLSAPVKEGEPMRPLVGGTISGLLSSNDLVTVRIIRADGWELISYTQLGNGQWEAIVYDPDESDYCTITAEADGYISHPASYEIWVEEETIYFVRSLEISDKTLRLNFHFQPCDS
jgi:hypothetical protein